MFTQELSPDRYSLQEELEAWQEMNRMTNEQAYREALDRIVGHIDNGPPNAVWIRAIAAGALKRPAVEPTGPRLTEGYQPRGAGPQSEPPSGGSHALNRGRIAIDVRCSKD